MSNEWDRDANILTEAERIEERDRRWREEMAEQERTRIELERRNYIRPPGMDIDEVVELFPRARSMYNDEQIEQYRSNGSIFMPWTANKLWYVCHNCGHIGWKYGRSHQLFKCYCGSRNLVLVRASQISKILREHPEGCTSMEDVYNERRERLRRERAQRSAERRNSSR